MIFALLGAVVVCCAGAGVDFARGVSLRDKIQSALDSAVLAGAVSEGDKEAAAAQFFKGVFSSSENVEITSGFQEQPGELTGTAKTEIRSSFLQIFGVQTLPVSVRSAVGISTSEACILVTDERDQQGFKANGSGIISMPNCEMHVRATGNPATWVDSRNITTKHMCVAGKLGGNARPWRAEWEEHCDAMADPFKNAVPVLSPGVVSESRCMQKSDFPDERREEMVFKPGTYCWWPNINGHVRLVRFLPGNYVFKAGLSLNSAAVEFGSGTYVFNKAGFNFNGSVYNVTMGSGLYLLSNGSRITFNNQKVVAHEVTIYLADKDSAFLTVQGSSKLDLTAPVSGPYKDLALVEAPGLRREAWSSYNLDGMMNVEGLLYLPSRNLHLNGSGVLVGRKLSIVLNKLSLDGKIQIEQGARSTGAGSAHAYLLR
ncbi:Tad domain-containing protein [Roseibium litorale]|uniref:Putative Flp pilus-assembly TadG-like N-terminal domain-containing protein n=1 Tax=Roseibium litorale TaxID=2803841 RepID=A0ABR9CTE7_9HYPH|nr:Tad domain-containing protein [Roseibium litorale]MBD8894150.1 hypothetical protein [Roseibium litorale]